MAVNAHVRRATATPGPDAGSPSAGGIEVAEDGLKEITFGEYLVEQQVLDRFQLFRALQMQDRLPGVRLGECAAALGYAPILAIEKLYATYAQLKTVEVEPKDAIELKPKAKASVEAAREGKPDGKRDGKRDGQVEARAKVDTTPVATIGSKPAAIAPKA